MRESMLDCVIIGAGPAGLAVARDLQLAGITARVYDKGPIAAHIYEYPTFMRFHSTRENVSLAGLPLTIPEDKPSRQQYCHYLATFVRHFALDVQTHHEVTAVERQPGGHFHVTVLPLGASAPEIVSARAVVVAVGSWEDPRRLDVPGATLPKVHYRFIDPHPYAGRRVLVVGGRNSALETALALWRGGAQVAIVHRGADFRGHGVKYWLAPDVENRIRAGEIRGFLNSHVVAIHARAVEISTPEGVVKLGNDFVLPQIGYHAPVDFLRRVGMQIADGESRPEHNPHTLETNVPGLFVAGVIAAGDVSGHIFIENARDHGKLITPRLRELLAAPQA